MFNASSWSRASSNCGLEWLGCKVQGLQVSTRGIEALFGATGSVSFFRACKSICVRLIFARYRSEQSRSVDRACAEPQQAQAARRQRAAQPCLPHTEGSTPGLATARAEHSAPCFTERRLLALVKAAVQARWNS